ncbi:MAG TPA: hypothetical protein VFQ88_15210 [Nevskiaceae bacterium]|nr:hypothetical protein [Nevskiaceae bacterium]
MFPSQYDVPYTPAPHIQAAPATSHCCTTPEALGFCRNWFERFADYATDDRGYGLLPQLRNVLATYPACDEQAVAARVRVLHRCRDWFRQHSPTAPLICGGNAKHPMLLMLEKQLDA